MKVMRSTKEGSVCTDCGTVIKIGDPIAYFGPGNVYGLTCHPNPKAAKHLARLLESEGVPSGPIQPQPNTPTTTHIHHADTLELSVLTRGLLTAWMEDPEADSEKVLLVLCAKWGVKRPVPVTNDDPKVVDGVGGE